MDWLAELADGDKDISEGAFRHFATETRRMLYEVLLKWTPIIAGMDNVPAMPESPDLHVDVHATNIKEFAGVHE